MSFKLTVLIPDPEFAMPDLVYVRRKQNITKMNDVQPKVENGERHFSGKVVTWRNTQAVHHKQRFEVSGQYLAWMNVDEKGKLHTSVPLCICWPNRCIASLQRPFLHKNAAFIYWETPLIIMKLLTANCCVR